MKKFREIYIHVSVYSVDVILLIGPRELLVPWVKNPQNIKNSMRDALLANIIKANQRGTPSGSTFFVGPGGGSLIWLPENTDPGVFTHEVSHVTHHIFKAKGIELCDESDEAFAYLLEYIWRELNPFAFRLKTKKR